MEIILLITSFVLLYFIYTKYNSNPFNRFIYSLLTLITLVLCMTETLSFFNLIDSFSIKCSWLLLNIFLSVLLLILKVNPFESIQFKFPKITFFSGTVAFVFVLLFIQAIVYPPNNYDAMTYHLARIPNWLSNRNINHYQTNIYRQLYQPPLSSILLLHINVLFNSDYLANSLQIFFLFASLKILKQIGNIIQVKHFEYVFLFVITIPSVVLQASSVTNNIIETTFILNAVLFSLKILKNKKEPINYLILGVSAGFGLMTKGTAYIYIFPVFLLLGFALVFNREKGFIQRLLLFFFSGIICVSINVSFYIRNYNLVNHFLGTDHIEAKKYSNEKIGLKMFVSNGLKNIGNHLGPLPINKYAEKAIYKVHDLMYYDINQKGANFDDFEFRISSAPNSEDNAPNFIHLMLVFFSVFSLIVYVFKRKVSKEVLFVFGICAMQITLFVLYLKWQPWHSRNHTALFFELAPLVVLLLFDKVSKKWMLKTVFNFLILVAVSTIFINKLRPLVYVKNVTSEIHVNSPRIEKYFTDRNKVYQDNLKIQKVLDQLQNQKVGIDIFWNEYEYPFFKNCYTKKVFPTHLFVEKNPSKNIKHQTEKVDYIVSNRTYLNNITYNNQEYQNLFLNNEYVSLFKIQ